MIHGFLDDLSDPTEGVGRVFKVAVTLEGCGYTYKVRLRGLGQIKVLSLLPAGFVRVAPG